MLSHTHHICQHSSNIIKHINIVSPVHKNYSNENSLNGFLLIFSEVLSPTLSFQSQKIAVQRRPEKRLFIHKYLSSKLLIVFAIYQCSEHVHLFKSSFWLNCLFHDQVKLVDCELKVVDKKCDKK